jgi:hypothetical protein
MLFVIQEAMSCMRSLLQILLIALTTVASDVAQAGRGVDLSREYRDAYDRHCDLGAADVRALRRHKVLFVPGYLVGGQPAYFAEQLDWLRSIEVESEKVAIRAGQSAAINGPIVAEAVRNSTKPVILITHSKGSVDALEALRAKAALRSKVNAWISLQGVFFGSPVADTLLDGTVVNPVISDMILGLLGGTRQSAEGLSTRAAHAYYRKHEAAIALVLRKVPAIAFVSDISRAQGAQTNTLLEISYDLMRREGILNDGLVPIDSAVLPDMDFVKVIGVDHIAPVMPTLKPYDRVRMIKVLLSLVLRAPEAAPPRKAGCHNEP